VLFRSQMKFVAAKKAMIANKTTISHRNLLLFDMTKSFPTTGSLGKERILMRFLLSLDMH
jgi:hypothetical protein